MGEALDEHEAVDAGGVRGADAVDVVAGEVDEHDVFGAVFEAGAQLGGEGGVLVGGLAALDGAGDGVRDYPAGVGFDEQFGAGADELEGAGVDVEEVGGWVEAAKRAVDVEGVEGGGAAEALGGHRLDDVAGGDVSF